MGVNLPQRWVATIDEIAQVFNRRRLVLNKDKQKVQAQRCECFSITGLIDRTDVRNTLKFNKKVASIIKYQRVREKFSMEKNSLSSFFNFDHDTESKHSFAQ